MLPGLLCSSMALRRPTASGLPGSMFSTSCISTPEGIHFLPIARGRSPEVAGPTSADGLAPRPHWEQQATRRKSDVQTERRVGSNNLFRRVKDLSLWHTPCAENMSLWHTPLYRKYEVLAKREAFPGMTDYQAASAFLCASHWARARPWHLGQWRSRQERYRVWEYWHWSHHSTTPPNSGVRQRSMACMTRW